MVVGAHFVDIDFLREEEKAEQVEVVGDRAEYLLLRADGSIRAEVSLIYREDLLTWVEEGARWCAGERLDILR